MEQTKQGFSLGWVFVSYFMIAGGFILAMSLGALMKLESEAPLYALYFVGAAFGGFFAGRASEGKTIIEPAIAGALLVVSFVGLMALVPIVRELWSIAGEKVIVRALGISALTGAGGLLGAALGERSSPPQRSDSAMRWMGISSLITLGMLFFLFAILAILLLRHAAAGGSLTDDEGATVVLVTLAGTALFGGMITQSIAPRKMCFACGTGFVVVVIAMFAVGVSQQSGSEGSETGGAAVGIIIIALGGMLVGALGALIGWKLFGRRAVEQSQQTDVAKTFE